MSDKTSYSRIYPVLALIPALILLGCGSSGGQAKKEKVIAPADMPDICRDLDFNRDVEFRELCGVITRDYKAYRNIPEHRNLLLPKGCQIVKKGKILELRLPNTLPVTLPDSLYGRFTFDEKERRKLIKSRMDYVEFFPDNANQRVKVIKLDIPEDSGGLVETCYTLAPGTVTAQRKTGYASRLEPLSCKDFETLKLKSLGSGGERNQGNPEVSK